MKPAMKPTSGRVVIYVWPEDETKNNNNGKTSPAVVVNAWEDNETYQDEGKVNLKVLADGPDNPWATSVPYSETGEPRTWHWPARV